MAGTETLSPQGLGPVSRVGILAANVEGAQNCEDRIGAAMGRTHFMRLASELSNRTYLIGSLDLLVLADDHPLAMDEKTFADLQEDLFPLPVVRMGRIAELVDSGIIADEDPGWNHLEGKAQSRVIRTHFHQHVQIPAVQQLRLVLAGERNLLEMVARGQPLTTILETIVKFVEAVDHRAIGVISLLSQDRENMLMAAGAGLPEQLRNTCMMMTVGPRSLCCGTAAYFRRQVVVEDISVDPLWAKIRESTVEAGIHSCWSTPVFDAQENLLGTIALYFNQPIGPDEEDQKFIDMVVGIAGIAIDRARTEENERNLQAKLVRAQRMESLGMLAGGVAHDLNNILGPVVGYPDLIISDLPEDSPIREDVMEIKASARRAAEVIQDLLTLARRGFMESEPVCFSTVISDAISSEKFRELAGMYSDLHIERQLDPEVGNVMATSKHLSQVLLNLAHNAFEAMSNGGTLRIRTYRRLLDTTVGAYETQTLQEGRYAILEITDTGECMSPEDIDHIFEPFYTKKKMGRGGTGLGLAVAYAILQEFDGSISLESDPASGTRFTVRLPLTEQEITGEATPPTRIQGSETVLVVDDVREQRDIASKLLGRLGYSVQTAESGQQAIDFLQSNQVDIVILDMIMENGFDGLDTYRAILDLYPKQRCIIASGYSETQRVIEAQRLGVGQYIRKPHTLDNIGTAVRTELDRPTRA
jgi:signal transduction histidine kinase/ActR/RegA family two-component response regulator